MLSILLVTGIILFGGGYFSITLTAFKKSVTWGVAIVILPPAAIAFLIMNMNDCIRPAIISSSGLALVYLAPQVLSL